MLGMHKEHCNYVFLINTACVFCNSYKNSVNFIGRMDAFIGKIKKKRNNEREVVKCAKICDGILQ